MSSRVLHAFCPTSHGADEPDLRVYVDTPAQVPAAAPGVPPDDPSSSNADNGFESHRWCPRKLDRFEKGLFKWTVVSGALECAAGLDILSYSTNLEEVSDNSVVWNVAGLSLPVIGYASVAINLAGKTYYMRKIRIVEGLYGGAWAPAKMCQFGFGTHVNYTSSGADRGDSWIDTPHGQRIELQPYRLTFDFTFAPPSIFGAEHNYPTLVYDV